MAPPYRARWIWCGPKLTLLNQDSQAGWTNDLRAREGYSYPMPRTVDFTLANSVQPVVAGGRVFVGSLEGTVYAIGANDGATLWSAPLPGGTSVAWLCWLKMLVQAIEAHGTLQWTDVGKI